MAKTRIAINGFGRIGKMAFKIALQHFADSVEIVAVNDPNTAELAAQGLKYDSVYGKFPLSVEVDGENLVVGGVRIPKLAEMDPANLPWGEMNVDIVLECTGVFRTKEEAMKHVQAGAKRVLISAPAKGDDPVGTYVMGVNHEACSADEVVISNASCTTNSVAPVMKVLEDEFGVEKAMLSTIHAYTANQNLIDGNNKDPRRARAAALNIVPTSTGAAVATTETIPSLQGKFDGMAFRVPTPVGSVSDITAVMKRDVTAEEVNAALKKAAEGPLKGVMLATDEPLVSTDIIANPHSSIVDLELTKVVDGNLLKVVAWYDNEYGYSFRMIEQSMELAENLNS